MRQAPKRNPRGKVEPGVEEPLVGLVAQGLRESPRRIGNHPLGRNNGVGFDSVWALQAQALPVSPRSTGTPWTVEKFNRSTTWPA
jgi:hypothetical protein